MKVTFRKSFARDIKKIKNQKILKRAQQAIENVEAAASLDEISHLKKLAGAANFYRIRIGEYRIGIVIDGVTVDFVRCLPRRDLYRFFP
jgi:mRNA interferase RelE/StbE